MDYRQLIKIENEIKNSEMSDFFKDQAANEKLTELGLHNEYEWNPRQLIHGGKTVVNPDYGFTRR